MGDFRPQTTNISADIKPKIKTYFTTLGKDLAEAEAQKNVLAAALKPILA